MTDHENMDHAISLAARAAAAKHGGSMDIAIVGADAPGLCRMAEIGARAFSALADASGRTWDLLALTRDASRKPFSGAISARSLLLPGDSDPSFAVRTGALQVVGYGFSPRDTLTLSSFAGTERLLCLQRSLLTTGGVLLEPQELPLSPALSALGEEQALFIAGLRLLTCARS